MKNQYVFSFDVESVGLWGPSFAVGWVLFSPLGAALSSGILAYDPKLCPPTYSFADEEWVATNIPPLPYKCNSLFEVTSKFEQTLREVQSFVLNQNPYGYILYLADCPHPVETNFLRECHQHFPVTNTIMHPLVDLGSIRLAKGLNPTSVEPRLPLELPIHDPRCDALQSGRLYFEAMRRG